jgi:molybdopterin-guanine dinucleotide biosynthesis protein A
MRYDGVVLAGGAGRRLGGVSKPALIVGGHRLLDVALGAVRGADTTVVVGPPLPTPRPVRWCREQPAGGGPVAALAAALPLLQSTTVVVLACDLPFVTSDAVEQLVERRGGAVAALAVDLDGREQPLLACYSVAALRCAMPAVVIGVSMRSLLDVLRAAGPLEHVRLDGDRCPTVDCDTDADLCRARELA